MANSAQAIVKGLDDLLTCPVCLDQLSDPRQLPCQHTFCAKCIIDLTGGQNANAGVDHFTGEVRRLELVCPMCRTPASVATGPDELPVDFRVNELLSLMGKLNTKDDGKGNSTTDRNCGVRNSEWKCSMCSTENAHRVHVCIDCGKTYCSSCHAKHVSMFQGHVHCSMETAQLHRIRCHDHGDFVRRFCLQCQKGICERCFHTQDHQSHITDDFAITEATAATDTLERTLAEKEEMIRKTLKEFCSTQDCEDGIVEQTKREIKEHKQALIQELNKVETSMLQELDTFAKKVKGDRFLKCQEVAMAQANLTRLKKSHRHSKMPLEGVTNICLKTQQHATANQMSDFLKDMVIFAPMPAASITFLPGPTAFRDYGRLDKGAFDEPKQLPTKPKKPEKNWQAIGVVDARKERKGLRVIKEDYNEILCNSYTCTIQKDGRVFDSAAQLYDFEMASYEEQPRFSRSCQEYYDDSAGSFYGGPPLRHLVSQKRRSNIPPPRKLGLQNILATRRVKSIQNEHHLSVMREVLHLKYNQVREFQTELNQTIGQTLAYASEETYWGTGLSGEETHQTNLERDQTVLAYASEETYWGGKGMSRVRTVPKPNRVLGPGQNMLGKLLEELRDSMKRQDLEVFERY